MAAVAPPYTPPSRSPTPMQRRCSPHRHLCLRRPLCSRDQRPLSPDPFFCLPPRVSLRPSHCRRRTMRLLQLHNSYHRHPCDRHPCHHRHLGCNRHRHRHHRHHYHRRRCHRRHHRQRRPPGHRPLRSPSPLSSPLATGATLSLGATDGTTGGWSGASQSPFAKTWWPIRCAQ